MTLQKITENKKNVKIAYSLLILSLLLIVLANFWVFARFTVDDAFITWRYGKNLVNHGIWNYNPSSYDMTQAYTNPIYAFLSIIPAYFHIDTVFFFKIFSFIVILLFGLWYSKKTKYGIIVLLAAFSLPQTMIHAFSGIETFLFIALVTILLVSIYEEAFCGILISSALLFYTRPESLTLPFIVPLLYCNWQSIGYKDVFNRQHYKWHSAMHFVKNFITIKSLLVFGILLLALLPNLIISYLNFHSILPNTFYVKNISISLGFLKKLIIYGLTLVPLLMSFRYISIKKFVPILLFFSFIVIQYAKTEFLMDYNRRSVYHILCPIVFFIFFIFGQWNKRLIIELKDTESNFRFSLEYKWVCKLFIFALLLLLLVRGIVSDSVSAVNYNYRLLNAHSAAGKVINSVKEKYGINSIACGDAGTLAFNADLDSLDFYELGSSVLTHKGINEAYPLYKPDVLFLHGNKAGVIEGGKIASYMEYARNISQYQYIGKIAWRKDYYLWVFSNKQIPELHEVFENSYTANYKTDRQLTMEHIFSPPWTQWHE